MRMKCQQYRPLLSVVFFVITSILYGVNATVNTYESIVTRDLTNCVSKLIEVNFEKPGVLIFANTKNASTAVVKIRYELLKRIHGTIKFSVEIVSPNNQKMICNHKDKNDFNVLHRDYNKSFLLATYYVVIIDSYKDFNYVVNRLINTRSWNPFGKFIILFLNISNAHKANVEYVESIISCLFKFNAINIAVILPQTINVHNAVVYGWKPFDPPQYCGYYNETVKNRLVIENICECGAVKHQRGIFDGKLPRDMKGCALEILALERKPFVSTDTNEPNIEVRLINELAKRHNFKTQYTMLKGFRGEREIAWSGALKYIVQKKGQILLGGIFPDFDVHEDFESSSSYLADSYTWVVPRAFLLPPWVALTITFQELVWYLIIAGFLTCVFTWKILGLLSGDSFYYKHLDHCFLNTWISTLGFSAYVRPVKQSLRVFFVFFNLYCIIFVTAYQTKLFDVLTNPSFEKQIKTVEELVASNLKFGGFEELHDLFFNSSDPFDNYIGEQWVDVDNITKALIDVVIHRNFSLLCSRLELNYVSAIMPELSDSFGNYKYYALDNDVFTVPVEMIALRGFAFMKEFSRTLNILKQSGINQSIRHNYAAYNMRKRARLLQMLQWRKSNISALSIQHLQGGFLALIIGYISGTLVLFIEVFIESRFLKIVPQRRFEYKE